MSRHVRNAVVAVVVVALLTVGAHVAMERPSAPAPSDCGSVTLWVSNIDGEFDGLDDDVRVTAYGNLSADARDAFDRARASSDPVGVGTDLAVESALTRRIQLDSGPYLAAAVVRYEGSVYHVMPRLEDCPLVDGVPRQFNPAFAVLGAIYRVFSPLYLPGGAVIAVVAAYRAVDDWLRFG